MKSASTWCLTILWTLGCAQSLHAQNLQITNARVIVGNGEVIERGSIVVRRGRIASVSDDAVVDSELQVLDAEGLTVMPGFIDAHRRVILGDPDAWMRQVADRMREYVEAGFTSVLSTGDPLEHVLELRDRLDAREIQGPRLLVSGSVRLMSDGGGAIPEEQTRETVLNLTLEGADAIASTMHTPAEGAQRETLSTARDEADQQGLMTITHIETVEDALAAVESGSGYLTRTPHIGEVNDAIARRIVETGRTNAEYGLVMTSTLGRSVPTFSDRSEYARGAAGEDDGRLSPDREAYPSAIVSDLLSSDLGPYPVNNLSSAARAPVNARRLRDAGIIYGFGTDSSLPPTEALRHELIPLKLVFSNEEIVDILTRSAAFAVRRDDALGTLEPGKIADMVILEGDPLTDLDNLFHIRVVVRTGQIVVDNR